MTVFNYFLPDRRAISLADLVAAGLGYAFAPETADTPRATFTPRPVIGGPGGANGIIVAPLDDRLPGYFPAKQTWKQDPAGYWAGYWNDAPPTPDTLARSNQIGGAWLRLEDGRDWLIPKARHFDEFDGEIVAVQQLPARLVRDELGNWVQGGIKERYRRLWDLTTEFVQAVCDDRQEFDKLDALAVEAFQVNYRVAEIELDLLGVYDLESRDRTIRIVTDLDGFAELLKKKQARRDSGPSPDGQSESRPAETTDTTGQP